VNVGGVVEVVVVAGPAVVVTGAEVVAAVVVEVAGAVEVVGPIVTPAAAQYFTPNASAAETENRN